MASASLIKLCGMQRILLKPQFVDSDDIILWQEDDGLVTRRSGSDQLVGS